MARAKRHFDTMYPLLAPLNALAHLTGVGSRGFVEAIKSILGDLAKGRKVKEIGEGYQTPRAVCTLW